MVRILLGPRVAKREGKSHLVVRPDFVFKAQRIAVFVDGCFWHSCPLHSATPETNRLFWEKKLAKNVERDKLVGKELTKAGWKVWRIWEHSLVDHARSTSSVKKRI